MMTPSSILLGLTLSDLQERVASLGMPSFTAKQLADWLYKKKVSSIEQMTNLSQKNRELLQEKYKVGLRPALQKALSSDGTIKYLFPTEEDKAIETVYIPQDDRATLCISSQVGCKMDCKFCMTGRQGFSGQLSAGDIINQIQSIDSFDSLTNIVLMGMGEPLDNIDAVLSAIEIMTAPWGYGWSPKRITLSTVGLLPGLKRFIEETESHLAVSLHTPFHEQRMEWMPIEKAYPAAEVIDFLRPYDWTGQRRLSFEYIVFKGLNDQPIYARSLANMLKGIEARVNLISFHPLPDSPFVSPDQSTMEEFQRILQHKGVICTIRKSRGMDISAACGLLSTQTHK